MSRFISAIDIFPGMKTYSAFVTLFGMLICQGGGFHMFSGEAWGAAITAALTFWKIGQDRDKRKNAPVDNTGEAGA